MNVHLLILSMMIFPFAQFVFAEENPNHCEEYHMPIFTPPGDPFLQMSAAEVPIQEILSDETQSLIDRMFEIAKGERTDLENRVMVGLAAPQIGIAKRIILVDIGMECDRKAFGELTAFINPEIVWYSDEKEYGREGCYSVDARMLGIVSRAVSIKVTALDRQGNPVAAEFSGFTAKIFQHEVDHLNGIRFPDRVGQEGGELNWVEEAEYPEYRENWKTWCRKCSLESWLSMKEGKPYEPPIKAD
jgi:peptide deformylase